MGSAAIYEQCSSCGVPSFPLVATTARIGRSREQVHKACGACLAAYQAQTAQNRRDEEQARKERDALAARKGKK